MIKKRKRTGIMFTMTALFLILSLLVWFLCQVFEGNKPEVVLEPLPKFLSKAEKFSLHLKDKGRGLRKLVISVKQGSRVITIAKKTFPFKDILNREGCHKFDMEFHVDPEKINLIQGEAIIQVSAWDYSKRRGGDGNITVISHKVVVDTLRPALSTLSRLHYLNLGGTGLVVYQTSSDTVKSGVFVGKTFFPGFMVDKEKEKYVCYFAVPYNTRLPVDIHLWAQDRAGNTSVSRFYYRVRKKRFRRSNMKISDRFLERVLPYFEGYKFPTGLSNIEKFIVINTELRKKNNEFFNALKEKTGPDQLWEGAIWLRLKNSATMAGFGDKRTYYYKGKVVGKAVHLGVDLASLAHSEVQASNSGKVIFAGPVGIYGLTVVIDHGQGLATTYSHLSKIVVKEGQAVARGELIAYTGNTGLAGGDHLHFGFMVNGVFVNPVEWWDPHWVKDNIIRKLETH